MRVFAAVVPPESIIEELMEFLAPRRVATDSRAQGVPSGWRWSRAEQLHLTLAFAPDLDLDVEERVIEAGQDWAAHQQPLELRLSGAGAFPDPVGAKVLWIAVAGPATDPGGASAPGAAAAHAGSAPQGESDGSATMSGWAHGLRAVISHAGGRPVGRAFRPHVTVARTGAPGGLSAARVLQSLDTYESSSWQVETIVWMQSTLGAGPRGTPRYDVRHEWSLRRGT